MLYMEHTATISSKGQITLPVEIRRGLKLQAGDKITIVKRGTTIEIKPRTYDEELSELRKRAQAHMKRNGTWGVSWEEARRKADEVGLEEYRKKHGSRA